MKTSTKLNKLNKKVDASARDRRKKLVAVKIVQSLWEKRQLKLTEVHTGNQIQLLIQT